MLTTDGLYVWGATNALISSNIKNTAAFGKITVDNKADGLPAGVIPGQVKMMFGSYQTLAIVTCSGEAWVLSMMGSKNGDGTTQNSGTPNSNTVWHRVRTSAAGNPTLDNVVAMRGTANALFALTSDGKLYTWGTNTYINSGTALSRLYATEVSVPAGATPKMIGMTEAGSSAAQSYYLLATNGKLYTMGDNSGKQLGDGSTTTRTTWVQPVKVTNQSGQGTGVLENIVWISPNEHSNYTLTPSTAAINVLTNNNKLWAWGLNNGFMYGGASATASYDPIYMPGNSTAANGMQVTDEIIAVETGGHTSINVKKREGRYGYVGHRSNGSLGDGSNANDDIYTYTYSTNILAVCAAEVGPAVKNIEICQNIITTANLNDANLETTPAQVEWHATNDANSPVMTNITAVPAGTYYAFFTVASGRSRTVGSPVTVTSRVCLSPGGVTTGLSYWYRADKNATNTGATTDVTAWTDMWNGTTVAQLGTNGLPKYAVGTSTYLNFNPGINFTAGTQTLGNNTVQTLTSLNYDVFTLTKEGMTTGGTNSRLFSIGMDNTTTGATNWDAFGISAISTTLERRVFGAASQLLGVNPAYSATIPNIMYFRNTNTSSIKGLNGAAFPGAATTYNAQGNQFGGHIFGSSLFSSNGSDNTGFVGNLGETIVYGAGTLSDTDRRRVDSYLAIKYGITLGQLSATGHYLDTDGNIVWNGGSNTTYNNNVFGVSRDDVEVFEQKVSKSVNSGTILTVATTNDFVNQNQDAARTGFANDKTYFLLGDNNVTTTGLTAITANGIAMNRIARIWLSQRKNTPNLLYFQPNLGGYGTTFASGNNVYMVVADDAAFTINVKTIAGAYVGGQWVFSNSFDSDNLQRYITFASSTAACPAGTTAPTVNAAVSNNCPTTTVNLNTQAHTGTIPANTTLVWFTNNAHTGTAYATPTAATAGTYYAFYYSSASNCYSPASNAVTVTITACVCPAGTTAPSVNTFVATQCPSGTANLITQAHTGAIPVNSTLLWFTDAAHTTSVPTPTAVGAGTYYAFYYSSIGDCYSPASAPINVVAFVCSACTAADPMPANLSSINVPAAPAGAVTQWHNSATPSASTLLSSTTVMATSTPTDYWVYYYDTTLHCYSPGSKAIVVSNACCNYPTVNLSEQSHNTVPNGSTLVWYTSSTHDNGTEVNTPLAVGNGTYWPFFYNSVNNTYSSAGSPVIVAVDNVCPVADMGYIYITKKALDENSSVDFNFTVNGGPVTAFQLNDKETTIRINDLGYSADGRLWAVAANNTLYYRNQGSSDWVQTSVTNAVRVDGASGTDCYFTNASGQVSRYDGATTPTVIGSAANFGSSNAVDVGSAWNTTPYIINANQTVWMYGGSGTTWTQVGTTTNNTAAIDADPSTGDAIVTDGTLVYRLTSAGVKTSLGTPGYVEDIAVTSAGEIFTSYATGFVRKWNTGTTWYADETTSRYLADRLTGGNKEQVWSTNTSYTQHNNIYTRVLAGTTATWLDDERMRTTNKGNSIMIKVPVGTYTVKETATSGWELQSMDVYDPTSNSTSNFTDQSVTLNVAKDETVHAVFTNGLVNAFAMGNDCSTVFFEDFGSGAVGSFGDPLTGQTSYHYSDGSIDPTEDGYYTVVGNTTDFAWWSTPSTFDHTDGTGRMMAINASYEKGIFFRRKFNNLVPGKSYKFSAWLMSLYDGPVKPNATFQVVDPVSGTVLNTVSSGDITTGHVWNEYSMDFVPTSTELDLILLNNAPGGEGNDIALDDIRFEMNKPQNLTASRDCSASTLTVTAPLGAIYEYSLDNLNWQASPSFTGVASTITNFYVRYADAIGCVSSATVPSCFCYKPGATTGGPILDTKVGISALGRAGEGDADQWPMTRKGGWIALEAKTKGFVPNRVAFYDADNNASTPDVPVGIAPANFVEGMMVYDITHGCMKVYTLKDGDITMAWHCVTTQTCPD